MIIQKASANLHIIGLFMIVLADTESIQIPSAEIEHAPQTRPSAATAGTVVLPPVGNPPFHFAVHFWGRPYARLIVWHNEKRAGPWRLPRNTFRKSDGKNGITHIWRSTFRQVRHLGRSGAIAATSGPTAALLRAPLKASFRCANCLPFGTDGFLWEVAPLA